MRCQAGGARTLALKVENLKAKIVDVMSHLKELLGSDIEYQT